MWLVENWGVDRFRDAVAARMGDTLSKVRSTRCRVPKPVRCSACDQAGRRNLPLRASLACLHCFCLACACTGN
jgi:sulfite reductase beta subunit-like hemoprotein